MKISNTAANDSIFKASLDGLAQIVSWGFPILIIGIVAVQYYMAYDSAAPIYSLLLMSALYGFGVLFGPRYYSIRPDGICIHRLFRNVNIPHADIQNLEIIPKEKISNAWRIFGVGGLFGYYGLFYNSQMGTMTFYATRTSNAILIKTANNKKIILTPDAPDAFLAYYKQIGT